MANTNANITISAEDKTQKAFNSIKRSFSDLSGSATSFSGLMGGLGVGLSVAGLSAFVKSNIDALDSLNDLSKSTGIAVEQLSGLSLASQQSGSDLDSVAASINKLSVNIGKDTEKFRALGITAKDPLEAFKQLSDVFVKIEDPQLRAAFAAEALGKSWAGAAPLLSEGGKAIGEMVDKGSRLSGITKKMAEDADKFNDQMAEFGVSARAAGLSFTSRLLPALTDIAQAMALATQEGGILQGLLVGFGGVLTKGLGLDDPIIELRDMREEVVRLQKAADENNSGGILYKFLGGAGKGAFDQQLAEAKITLANLESIYKDSRRNQPKEEPLADKKSDPNLEKQLCEFSGGHWDGKKCVQKSSAKPKKAVEDTAALDRARSTADLTQEIDKLNNVDQSSLDLLQQKLDAYSHMDPALKAYNQTVIDGARAQQNADNDLKVFTDTLEREAEAANAADEANQAFRDSQDKGYTDLFEQLSREQEDLNVSMITSDKKRIQEQLRLEHEAVLAKIYEKNLDLSATEDLIERETKIYEDKLKQASSTTTSLSKDLGLTFKSAFEDAVVGSGDFSDALQGLEQDIIRLAARRTILDPLLKAFDQLFENATSSGGSGLWDFITGIFTKNADGNVYNSKSLSAFSGGVYNSPQVFAFARGAGVFAEDGPEAILPLSRGSDGKLGVNSNGGGGSGVNVTVNLIESPGNGGQVNQQQNGNTLTLDIMVEKIESIIGRNISKGRGIAPTMERQYGLNRAAGSY